jgi:aspartate 1-decarboxylase
MLVKILKGKLHRATVTEAKMHYAGSIEIDSALMDAAGILPYEAVVVADVTNGQRLETYAVPAEAHSGRVVILGAAAHKIKPEDLIIVFSFGYFSPEEAKDVKPRIVIVGEGNKVKYSK